jgi:hypothetical protein
MKTYIDHLKSVGSLGSLDILKRPVLRSSAIFPFFINNYLDTRVLFMGYWFLKRNIKEIFILITVRLEKGEIIIRESLNIDNVKAFCISVKNKLLERDINFRGNLKGSIELEVFSTKNLFFPFPAFVVNYDSKNTSSFVHTCGRTFNDINDYRDSLKFLPPETGFDILPGDDLTPFFSFVNGDSFLKNQRLSLEILCDNKIKIKKNIIIKKLKPYETKFIFFLNKKEKKNIHHKCTLRIKHNFKSFFPRFLSGNFTKNYFNASLTHSYYDLKDYNNKKHFWLNHNKLTYFDSMISIPIFFNKKYLTELAIYPNFYFKNIINFNIEIFDQSGRLLRKIDNFFCIKKKFNKPYYLNINKFVKSLSIPCKRKEHKYLFARITFDTRTIPPRLKFGLNIGYNLNKRSNLPSNVCFNAMVPDEFTVRKKGTFKWAPIINKSDSKIIISNMSNLKNGFRKAKLILKFWREKDSKFIKKILKLKDNASFCFELNNNKVIKNFLNKKTGWITIESDNPYVNGYYFEDNGSNAIGADHFF